MTATGSKFSYRHGDARPGAIASMIALVVIATIVHYNSVHHTTNSSMTIISTSGGRDLAEDDGNAHGDDTTSSNSSSHSSHPHYALLWPIVAILVGECMHYILGRYLRHIIPYTAAMFGFGVIMGTVLSKLPETQFSTSLTMWSYIDGHVVLSVFLPGLLFKDAFNLDIHLFRKAFGQCIIMAFPEVLAGTTITACILSWVFPYFNNYAGSVDMNDAFIASMVLGSVLSATDPVAVSALLNEVGAPPRLKTHIAGESLLNDGAAVVFFNIFFNMDLYTFTGGAAGRTFNWGTGIAYFLKLSLGSAALGISLGLMLVGFLWVLKQRYNHEENVVQIMSTVGMAYLSFYLSESICGMSGIITVVFTATFAKMYGGSMINDQVGMEKFWCLLEHILNTVLFALGGLIFGTVITNNRGLPNSIKIGGTEWGYLFALYFFLLIIRAVLMLGFYPIISNIGLKSNWQEGVFMTWGGLRGAVGIALGILIENAWRNVDVDSLNQGQISETQEQELLIHQAFGQLWFFFAGGIAFLTLFINGSTAGPLLIKLGLAAPTKIRKAIVNRYLKSMSVKALQNMLHLLADSQMSDVDFATVRFHMPQMVNITTEDIIVALRRLKGKQNTYLGYSWELRTGPNVTSLAPFFPADKFSEIVKMAEESVAPRGLSASTVTMELVGEETEPDVDSKEEAIEMRKVFICLLEKAYAVQLERGFVDARAGGFLYFKLTSSLEITGDNVSQGEPINDFETCQALDRNMWELLRDTGHNVGRKIQKANEKSEPREFKRAALDVQRVVACITTHEIAQEAFKGEFYDDQLSPVVKLILSESDAQIQQAKDVVAALNPADVKSIKAHVLCAILLNEMVHDAGSYVKKGLLLPTEAEDIIHSLELQLSDLDKCDGSCDEKRTVTSPLLQSSSPV